MLSRTFLEPAFLFLSRLADLVWAESEHCHLPDWQTTIGARWRWSKPDWGGDFFKGSSCSCSSKEILSNSFGLLCAHSGYWHWNQSEAKLEKHFTKFNCLIGYHLKLQVSIISKVGPSLIFHWLTDQFCWLSAHWWPELFATKESESDAFYPPLPHSGLSTNSSCASFSNPLPLSSELLKTGPSHLDHRRNANHILHHVCSFWGWHMYFWRDPMCGPDVQQARQDPARCLSRSLDAHKWSPPPASPQHFLQSTVQKVPRS